MATSGATPEHHWCKDVSEAMAAVAAAPARSLTIVTGCMFAGKTTTICRLMQRDDDGAASACIAYFTGDGVLDSTSHNPHYGLPHETIYTRTLCSAASRAVLERATLVFIDELPWFVRIDGAAAVVAALAAAPGRVVATGLSSDYLIRPFEGMPEVERAATRIVRVRARCVECGGDADYTRRIADATHGTNGANGTNGIKGSGIYAPNATYEPVCRAHHPAGATAALLPWECHGS